MSGKLKLNCILVYGDQDKSDDKMSGSWLSVSAPERYYISLIYNNYNDPYNVIDHTISDL